MMKLLFEVYGKYKFKSDGWFRHGKLFDPRSTKQEIEQGLLEILRQHATKHRQLFSFCIGLNNRVYTNKGNMIKNKSLLQLEWDDVPYFAFLKDIHKIRFKLLGEGLFDKSMIKSREDDEYKIVVDKKTKTINSKVFSHHLICFQPIKNRLIKRITDQTNYVDPEFKKLFYENDNTTIRIGNIKYGTRRAYKIQKECMSYDKEEQRFYQIVKHMVEEREQDVPELTNEEERELMRRIARLGAPKINYVALTKYKINK